MTGQMWSTGDFTADAALDFSDLVIPTQHYDAGAAIVLDAPPTFAADWAPAQSLVAGAKLHAGGLATSSQDSGVNLRLLL